jgi:hypothetical protein
METTTSSSSTTETTRPPEPLFSVGGRKTLPTEKSELEAALSPHYLMADSMLHAMDVAFELLKVPKLSREEHNSGRNAIAAVLWKYDAAASPEVLLLGFVGVSVLPRAWAAYQIRKAAAEAAANQDSGEKPDEARPLVATVQ